MKPPFDQPSRGRRRAAAALALCLAGALGVSACGASGADSDQPVDQITVGVAALPVGVDPIAHNEGNAQMVYKLVNESLYRYSGPEEITPLLAADMPKISKDRKTWTIPLKKGVKFTNGDAFDAEDVVFTFEEILDPDNASYNSSALSAVKSMKAVDPQTVEITLNQPFSPLMYQLTRLGIVTSSIDYEPNKTYTTELVGTGPYQISKITRGQEIAFEANPDFREEGVPKVSDLVVKSFPDENSRLSGIKGGQIQVLPQLSPSVVSTVEEFASVYESESDLVAVRYWMWPNLSSGVMADAKVRKAVTIAVDRGRVVENALRGYGYPISTLPAARDGATFYSPSAQEWGSDPQLDEAQGLVEEAGVTGEKLHVVVPQDPGMSAVADSVLQQLEELGFDVDREDLTKAAAFSRLLDGNYDLYLNGGTPATGESGLDATYGLYGQGGAYNLNGVDDDELDRLVREAVEAEEPDEVIEQMRQRQLEYLPDVPIANGSLLTAFAEGVDGFEMYNFGDYYGLAYVE